MNDPWYDSLEMRLDRLRGHTKRCNSSMYIRGLLVFFVLSTYVGLIPPRQVMGATSSWQSLAPGIDYREFYLTDPNRVYVARLDRENSDVALESGIGQGRLIEGAETVRDIATRYDQAINYWGETWGNRNRVVVAINGFFFDPETGIPRQGQVQGGWYAKRFDDLQNHSGIAWSLDQSISLADCVKHFRNKQFLTILKNEERIPFDGINTARGVNKLILFTQHFDTQTHTTNEGVEILVELTSPLLMLPEPEMVIGTVRSIQENMGNSTLEFDHVILSASGGTADRLLSVLQIGDQIGISQELKQYESDCRTPAPGNWEKAYAALGASFIFLRAGELHGSEDLGALLRSPRTVVAYNDRFIYFIVVDGRDRFQSRGMSILELAVFAKTRLGAVWGVALDGGGSSTMVVNGDVKNRPNVELVIEGGDGNTDHRPILERVVGNSLMMVRVEPRQLSSEFQPGDRVITVRDVEVRLGPGTNYGSRTIIPANSEGMILKHDPGLNGVLAKDYYWWKVVFGDVSGWIIEDALSGMGTD